MVLAIYWNTNKYKSTAYCHFNKWATSVHGMQTKSVSESNL